MPAGKTPLPPLSFPRRRESLHVPNAAIPNKAGSGDAGDSRLRGNDKRKGNAAPTLDVREAYGI
jgi:hypothetical protein